MSLYKDSAARALSVFRKWQAALFSDGQTNSNVTRGSVRRLFPLERRPGI